MIISGITLAMHYTPHVDYAFNSVEHIMRDVNSGWQIRLIHSNGASFFFIQVYIHIGRNQFYGSYRSPRHWLWTVGVGIQILMMGTAFQGYVQPWGQMSFWGATVITNFASAIPWIGNSQVQFIWGSFSVDNPTQNRFFSLHYLLPFIQSAQIAQHQYALHVSGSNNPTGVNSDSDKIRFHPYYTVKDIVGFMWYLQGQSQFVFFYPYYLAHADNSIPANPMVTPHSIVPEWYFQPYYAILRAIPDKQGGVLAMLFALQILLPLPVFASQNVRSQRYKPILHLLFWVFVSNFVILTLIGAKPIAEPFTTIGQLSSVIYFSYFIILFIIG